jgi:selenocysteine lyase/cysteine desulfurase
MSLIPTEISELNLEQWRIDTPGCTNVLHFNNAGAALMPKPVLDTMTAHLQREAMTGGYEAARQMQSQIDGVYYSLAKLLNAKHNEIALMQSATNAWQQVFYSLPFRSGDRILTCMSEYASNYIAYLQVAQKTGAVVDVIPNDESGQVCTDALASMLDDRVKLIAITHIPTNGGLVNPAEAIGKIAREGGIPFLLDACQSVGQMPIDVEKIGCDFLSATSRKYLRGPRGAGFLYVNSKWFNTLEPAMLDLHSAKLKADAQHPSYQIRSDARRFETWEASYVNYLGLGAAVDYALSIGLSHIWQRVQMLSSLLRKKLSEIPGVTVRDLGQTHCGIVSLTMDGHDPSDLCTALEKQRINVSWSPSEYTLLDMEARHLKSIVRASVHYYNTTDEIDRFCTALKNI